MEVGNSASNETTLLLRDLLSGHFSHNSGESKRENDNGVLSIGENRSESDEPLTFKSDAKWLFDPRPIVYDQSKDWTFRFEVTSADESGDDDGGDCSPRVTITRTDDDCGWKANRYIRGRGRKVLRPIRFRLYRISKGDEIEEAALIRTLPGSSTNSDDCHVYTYRGELNERPPAHVKIVIVHSSVGVIRTNAFINCKEMTVCIMKYDAHGSGVHTIEARAFAHCENLKVISFTPFLKEIQKMAFINCVNLGSIFIPPTIQSVGDNAFQNCSKVKLLTLPDNLRPNKIGRRVIQDCDDLMNALLKKYGANSDGESSDSGHDDDDDNKDDNSDDEDFRLHPNVITHLSDKCEKMWLKERYNDLPLHKLCYYSVTEMKADMEINDLENGDEKKEGVTVEEGDGRRRRNKRDRKRNDNGSIGGKGNQRKNFSNGNGHHPRPSQTILQRANQIIQTQKDCLIQTDDQGMTPLHILCMASSANLDHYTSRKSRKDEEVEDEDDNNISTALLQLIFQADPSAATIQDIDGKCPIHYAASNIGFPWAKFLVPLASQLKDEEIGMKKSPYPAASIVDNTGKTALHYLASNPYITKGCIKSLYDVYPRSATMQDYVGRCPIHYAVTNEAATIHNYIDILANAKTQDISDSEDDTTSHTEHAATISDMKNETATALAMRTLHVPLDICVYMYELCPLLGSEIRHTGVERLNRLEQVMEVYITKYGTNVDHILQASKTVKEGFVCHITSLYKRDHIPLVKKWVEHLSDPTKFPINKLRLVTEFRGRNGRTLAEYSPPPIKYAIAERTAFLQRYELVESPPIHMSQKLLVLKAFDLDADDHYSSKYDEYCDSLRDGDYFRKRGLDSGQMKALVKRVFSGKMESLEKILEKFDEDDDEFLQRKEFVKFCIETFDAGQKRTVALKFMSNPELFEKETKIREEFESRHDFLSTLVSIDASFSEISDDEFDKVLHAISMERDDLPPTGYRYVHAMPCGDRSLESIYRLEQPNLNQVRGYCEEIAQSMRIVHDHGVCCGKLTMNAIVRFNGALKLADLSNSVRKHEGGLAVKNQRRKAKYYVGSQVASGVMPPEMIHSLDAHDSSSEGEYNAYMTYFKQIRETNAAAWRKIEPQFGPESTLVVKTFLTEPYSYTRHGKQDSFLAIKGNDQDLPYSPVLASEAIDLWSFGSLMYALLTGRPLFDLDRSGCFKSFESMKELFTWSDSHKLKRLADIEDSAARDLLETLLSRDPKERGTFRETLEHVFFKASKAGIASADIAEKLEMLANNQKAQMAALEKIDKATVQIDKSIKKSSQSIMKAVFEATEVTTPTCFILRPKEIEGESEEDLVARTGGFLNKIMTSFDAVNTMAECIKDPSRENVLSVTDIFIGHQRETYSLYLIDEYTGETVDPPYEVQLNGDMIAEYLPVMTNAWRVVSTFNTAAGFAKAFFPLVPIPTIPSQTMDDMNNVIGVLGSDNNLMVEASESGKETTVRGGKLRNFEKFLIETEKDQNLNFAGLRRVSDKDGNAIWVTEESFQAMEKGTSEGSEDSEVEITQLKSKIALKDDEIHRLQKLLKEKELSEETHKKGRKERTSPTIDDAEIHEEIDMEWGLAGCFGGAWRAISASIIREQNQQRIAAPQAEEK